MIAFFRIAGARDRLKILAAATILLIGGSYFFAGKVQSTVASVHDSRPLGPAEIYTAYCAKCHGSDGRAKTAKGKRAGATDLTSDWNTDEARGIRIITNGKGEMPSFKRKLKPDEIRSVFQYVVGFRR